MVEGGVPPECTLATVEQPLRLREFDDVFGNALRRQVRVSPLVLRWVFDPHVEARVADLTARESECCSFFRFTIDGNDSGLVVDVEVPPAHVRVLDALQARAGAKLPR